MALERAKEFHYDGSYLPFTLATAALSILLFVCNSKIMDRIFYHIKTASLIETVNFKIRMVSMCHLAVILPLCLYAFLFIAELESDPIWYDSSFVRSCTAITSGYLIADAIICAVFYEEMGSVAFFCHHFCAIYSFHYATSYGILPYFANFRLLGEFSTPFYNMKGCLETLGFKNQPVYVINGVLFTLSFFISRIFVLPIYWEKVYSVLGTADFIILGYVQYALLLCCFFVDLLNIYWFCLMCKGTYKGLSNYFSNSKIS